MNNDTDKKYNINSSIHLLSTLSLSLLTCYFFTVLLLDEKILGFRFLQRDLLWFIGIGTVIIHKTTTLLFKRRILDEPRLKNITILVFTSFLLLNSTDLAYSFYLNHLSMRTDKNTENLYSEYYRVRDPRYWSGERAPRYYFPRENVCIYKPNVKLEHFSVGENYYSELNKSSTVTDSVLQMRKIKISIDSRGFRETSPLSKSRMFVLGDSYAFGWNTSQEKTWPVVLEKMIDAPIYNLGVGALSPPDELNLLKYFLETYPDSVRMQHLLWLIFEGNDLEGDLFNPSEKPKQQMSYARRVANGTVAGILASILPTAKRQSVINRLLKGRISLKTQYMEEQTKSLYWANGVKLLYPLYYSNQLGYRFFDEWLIKNAAKDESYVRNHPNGPFIDRTFKEMRELSIKHDFKITVLIAPSAPRLYAPHFKHFPKISDEPHFIRFIEGLSEENGFDSINLYEKLKPLASQSLFYWQDDTHWNEQGNAEVAEIVSDYLKKL